jgi:hypothetical protein
MERSPQPQRGQSSGSGDALRVGDYHLCLEVCVRRMVGLHQADAKRDFTLADLLERDPPDAGLLPRNRVNALLRDASLYKKFTARGGGGGHGGGGGGRGSGGGNRNWKNNRNGKRDEKKNNGNGNSSGTANGGGAKKT